MSWAEAKWTVDNVLKNIGPVPNNMREFTAVPAVGGGVALRFLEPADSYADGELICRVKGVVICMGENEYPTSPNEGTVILDNTELGMYSVGAFVVPGLSPGTTYYFSAFPYSTLGAVNTSGNSGNRLEAQTKNVENVKVTLSVDDTSEFDRVAVFCVDETDSASSSSAAYLTPSQPTVTLAVVEGDTYHLEYGQVANYSTPETTASRVAIGGATTEYQTIYKYFTARLNVTYPEGAVCTCSLGDIVYQAPDTSGSYQFVVNRAGTWTLSVTDGVETDIDEVDITEDEQTVTVPLSFLKVYGISRDASLTSPAWIRTDDAVAFTATASVGTVAGSSSFDTCYPWREMVRETLPTGDVMVKIPKFWFKRYREGTVEYIKVADKPAEGFKLHPAFNHGGVESECVYVGAYKTSSGFSSIAGIAPGGTSLANHRTGANGKGTGWWILDVSTWSAIQMLILVEFANNNVQAVIGNGMYGTHPDSGSCDSVPNLTGRPAGTASSVGVVWRGIENLWSSVGHWVDGAYGGQGSFSVSNNPADYATRSNHVGVANSYLNKNADEAYISNVSLDTTNEDHEHIMAPAAVLSAIASSTTGFCDDVEINENTGTFGWKTGTSNSTSSFGLFSVDYRGSIGNVGTSSSYSFLLYIPS